MATTNSGFRQSLGLLDSTMVVMGSMIGSGVFIVSSGIARDVGSGYLLLLVWAISGLLTLIAAMSYGELAALFPKAGGQYVYLREAYGKLPGFLYGWTLFTVIQTGTIAAVAIGFAKFTGVFFTQLVEKNILFEFDYFGAHHFSLSAAQLLAIASLIFLTWFNTRGISGGKILQTAFTSAKIIAVFGLIVLGIVAAMKSNFWNANTSMGWQGTATAVKDNVVTGTTSLTMLGIITAIGLAMVGSLFSSDAWNNITFIAGEVKNPKKNIPLSLLFGTLIVTAIYLSINIVYLMLLPLGADPSSTDAVGKGIMFATSDRVGVAAASQIFGNSSMYIMAGLIIVSTFGCNNGLILAGARVYYAMSLDKLFFRQAGVLNKTGVPARALWLQCVWACILCLSGTYGDLLDYVVFAVLIFYILTIAGIFILRKKMPDAERPYKAFGYPVVPAIYILLALAICVDLLIYKPNYTWPGLIIVLLGIPVFFIAKNYFSTTKENQG